MGEVNVGGWGIVDEVCWERQVYGLKVCRLFSSPRHVSCSLYIHQVGCDPPHKKSQVHNHGGAVAESVVSFFVHSRHQRCLQTVLSTSSE